MSALSRTTAESGPSETGAAALKPLPRSFYEPTAARVAPALLGHWLIRRTPEGLVGGPIVETEAYVANDPACHAAPGLTKRNRVMFGPPGYAYVYLIYGFHFCVNAVCQPAGLAEALLIRAIEARFGVALMLARRAVAVPLNLTNGPGKLCMAMSVDKQLNGADLLGTTIWIEDRKLDPGPIRTSPRVGVDYAGEYKDKPWRFFVDGNEHVSRVRFK